MSVTPVTSSVLRQWFQKRLWNSAVLSRVCRHEDIGKNNMFVQVELQLQFSLAEFLLLLMINHTGQTHLDPKRPRNYMAVISEKDNSYYPIIKFKVSVTP